ncbi:hypothetical protein P7C71_g179, partial [Lecanoromycetidae sp. Uapishka_2]
MADLAMENSTINVDPSGDLTLLVGDPDKEAQQSFLVSSKAMQLASPVWATLFDPQGRFLEANAKEVSLPDDDPHALLILLHIAHLNFDLITSPVNVGWQSIDSWRYVKPYRTVTPQSESVRPQNLISMNLNSVPYNLENATPLS